MPEIFSKLFANTSERDTRSKFDNDTNGPQNRQYTQTTEMNESFAGIVSSFTVYKLLSELVKPFTQLEAYREGLIDANGNFTKPEASLTRREKQVLSPFNRLIIGIKRLILSSGSSKLKAEYGSIPTAARAMAMECKQLGGDPDLFLEELEKALSVLCEEGEAAAPIGNAVGNEVIANLTLQGGGPKIYPGRELQTGILGPMRRRKKNVIPKS